jgi:hypothetical protein
MADTTETHPTSIIIGCAAAPCGAIAKYTLVRLGIRGRGGASRLCVPSAGDGQTRCHGQTVPRGGGMADMLRDRFCTTLFLSSGPGATGSTGVRVEGGQGVCGRGGGGGGLIYWEDMAYHCHPLLRDVLQRCCCCCGPSSLGAVRCFLIPLVCCTLLQLLGIFPESHIAWQSHMCVIGFINTIDSQSY